MGRSAVPQHDTSVRWQQRAQIPLVLLVSSTLRDVVIGSGLEFEDRGTHQLKGVLGEWRLFAVASR
jgi:hypothetical protein